MHIALGLTLFLVQCASGSQEVARTSIQPPIYSPYFRSKSLFQANPVRVDSVDGNPLLAFFLDKTSQVQSKIEVMMDSEFTVTFDFVTICISQNISLVLQVNTGDSGSMDIIGNSEFLISCQNATGKDLYNPDAIRLRQNTSDPLRQVKVYVAEREIDVKLKSGIIGFGVLKFLLYKVSNGTKEHYFNYDPIDTKDPPFNETLVFNENNVYEKFSYDIAVVRKVRPVDIVFRLCIYCVQIFVATGFGAKLQLDVVKENVMRPVAVAIGLACQYILMPMV